MARRELSETCLEIRAMGLDARQLEWFEAPPPAALDAAEQLLRDLGAVDSEGALTASGRRMALYPLHPRLGRLLTEADRRGAGEDGCALAALLSAGTRIPKDAQHSGPSDLLLLLDLEWEPNARRIFQQLRRVSRLSKDKAHDEALLLSVLAAFPDRVARRRQGDELLLASGGSALLSAASVVRTHDWLVAVDIEERRERGLPLVRLASAIEPGWLVDLFPERVTERSGVTWNRKAERVEAASALLYAGLVLEENRGAAPDPGQAAELLAEKALEAGAGKFTGPDEIEEFLARVSFASVHAPVPDLREEDVNAALVFLCRGLRSFSELTTAAGSRRAGARPAGPSRAGGGASSAGRGAGAHPPARRPAGPCSLRAQPGALGGLAASGFLWTSGDSLGSAGQGAAGRPSSRAEPAAGADHHGPGRFLGASLSESAPRAQPAVSAPRVAGEPALRIRSRISGISNTARFSILAALAR